MNANFTEVMIVDDDLITRTMMEEIFLKGGFQIYLAENGKECLDMINGDDGVRPDLIFLDVMMPEVDGFDTFEKIRDVPGMGTTPIIFITSNTEQAIIRRCFDIGAADYISKPVRESEILARTTVQLELMRHKRELDEMAIEHVQLKDRLLRGVGLEHPEAFKQVLTVSSKMHAIFQYIESISKTTRPVFITGETGTGKELVAQGTHGLSGRSGKFVPLNVAGLDDNLFSDTLFGHVKGAFTGAMADRSGLIEEAAAGTLFLDEIGDLDMLSQVKLLRLLQEGEYYPLGSDQRKFSDARIVVATHQHIPRLVEQGRFRKDLYYRLRTHHVHIPPLRERKCDLGVLVDHFMRLAADALLREGVPIAPEGLLPLLEGYDFPGNIRELEALIFDAVSRTAGDRLSLDSFKVAISRSLMDHEIMENPAMQEEALAAVPGGFALASGDLIEKYLDQRFPTLKEFNELLINKALDRSHGNQAKAARMLGLSRQALNKRLKRKEDD